MVVSLFRSSQHGPPQDCPPPDSANVFPANQGRFVIVSCVCTESMEEEEERRDLSERLALRTGERFDESPNFEESFPPSRTFSFPFGLSATSSCSREGKGGSEGSEVIVEEGVDFLGEVKVRERVRRSWRGREELAQEAQSLLRRHCCRLEREYTETQREARGSEKETDMSSTSSSPIDSTLASRGSFWAYS